MTGNPSVESGAEELLGPARHQAVGTGEVHAVPSDSRPTPGPIAVLPAAVSRFVTAVERGGGVVAPLSDSTRGLIWLASDDRQTLLDTLDGHPGIEWVQLPWAGVDAFSEVLASFVGQAKPLWTSAKGAYAQPVAEHALTLVLALLRVIPTRVRAGSWSLVPEGRSLYGMTVVILGAGGIAVELIRLLAPFGVRITVVRRKSEAVPGAEQTVTFDHLHDALRTADVLVVAAALTSNTSGLIGAEELASMKSDAILVNIARGGLVDTVALTEALARGTIAGAGIDVTAPEPLPDGHPLWNEPRIIITPHSADTPDMTGPLLAERITVNVSAFLGDGRFVGVVDPAQGY